MWMVKETIGFYTVDTVDSQNVYINDSIMYMCVSKNYLNYVSYTLCVHCVNIVCIAEGYMYMYVKTKKYCIYNYTHVYTVHL